MDVLLLDSDATRAALLVDVFTERGDSVRLDHGDDTNRLRRLLDQRAPDLLIAALPLGDGVAPELADVSRCIPVLLLTNSEEEPADVSFAQDLHSLSGGGLRHLPRVAERVRRDWRLMADLRSAAQALRESEERLRMVADFTADWEYWMGPNGRFLYVSPACEGVTGYAASELLADPGLMARIIHPDDRRLFREHMRRVMNGSTEGCNMDLRIVCHSGETRWISHVCQAVRHNDGTWWGRRGSNRDITERKNSEAELARLSAELRGLSAHLQTVREEERRRIAERIHDELGQALTALKIDAVWLERRLSSDESALAGKTREMIETISATLSAVQRLSLELRPRLLDDLGLPAALEWQTAEFTRHTGVRCSLQVRPEEIALPRRLATALFRIVQEALTNVARHANANLVEVVLELRGETVIMTIQDDGCGVSEEALHNPTAFGLMQMRERAIACGGELLIEGHPGWGTAVRICVPFPSGAKQ